MDSVDSCARLVILEAETGSGKTEAALWRFTRLLAAGVVSGLYFAVPTRAAARQLHGRVDKALRRVFGAAAPEAVLAIPGMLRAGEYTGQRLPHWRVRWDDDAATAPQRWAAEPPGVAAELERCCFPLYLVGPPRDLLGLFR